MPKRQSDKSLVEDKGRDSQPPHQKANWERPVAIHIFLADAADSAKNISIELEIEMNKMRK